MRFDIEPEYVLEEGCRCLSCFEPTGRWRVSDIEDKIQDVYFATEKDARDWVRRFMDKHNYETHHENTKVSEQVIDYSND